VTAGIRSAFDAASAVLGAISQRVFYIGETPSSANLVKLCGNFAIFSAIETMAEAMTLAQKGGVSKKQLLEIFTGTLFDTPLYRNYGAALVENRFRPAGFAAPLGLKDMRLVSQAADALRVPMPVLSVLRDHLLQTIGAEGEDIDWSGIALTIAKNGGVKELT
jgi:3-hydroxyisobutyrate dehydrogenase-like beta-hydroxyacid dehydrogenase